MVETLKSFEQVATRLSPIVLVLPGLAATAVGLFIWLGGLGFRRLLLVVMGALTGAFCTFCLVGQNPGAMVLVGLLGALVALAFQRTFAGVLLGGTAGVVAFLTVSWPYPGLQQGTPVGQIDTSAEGQVLTLRESLEVVSAYSLDLKDGIKRAADQVVAARWAMVVAVVFVLLLVGLLFGRLGGALSCSILGTAMIFAGLVLLLMFKGSAPVMRIEARAPFFGPVFLAMIAFGTLEQWILCCRADRRSQAETPKPRSRKTDGKRSWRDR